ncbi:glycoside hydrolase family 125 protein [Erysipelothrix sp. HDW6B]|uniref:glycoside hydrolase family 125 protein n=1 Tax=Erysipelothrix TaxID=1647 RepID=UPI0013585817|nr:MULTISPECIES: glycoside hydrolase family 125 protein [Erysipelothrix]QIK85254.1 glycoside hydrolase family 125 protein [Erysipelothrix sp. HDW6B]
MTVYKEMPKSVRDFMNEIAELCGEEHKGWSEIFENVYSNTLLTTIKRISEDDTYVLTGDIPAMWLRDSTAQVRPYLPIAERDADIQAMIRGVISRQFDMILHDPYANAFNEDANGAGHQTDDTTMTPLIWERKYEIDSLCYPIQLSYLYYQHTQDATIFDDRFKQVAQTVIDLWVVEQDHTQSPYNFERPTDRKEDTLTNGGRGGEVARTGMTWSGFRPSDDACEYNYLVPSNMFAVVVLEYMETIFTTINVDANLANQAQQLKLEIKKGIEDFAVFSNGEKDIYAYEVDGLGNALLIDDPNVPSLLAAPYLGFCDVDDVLYQNTRDHILSPKNKYFYEGQFARGCGSSHTPEGYIWPIALSIEGLTTNDKDAKAAILNTLVATDGGTKMMHESFDVNNPTNFTREWFSWANMMFCELVMDFFDIKVKR